MNTDSILRLLKNAGFNILGADSTYIYLEDPSCILRSFQTFIEYAWIAITFMAGVFLFGWAISLIRGNKNDYYTNIRNLFIMFGTLAAVGPIVNIIWGDDLFARGCRNIRVSVKELNTILEARDSKLKEFNEFDFYENLDIYDSGVPYSDAPLAVPDIPPEMESVQVSVDENTFFPPQSTSNSNDTDISSKTAVKVQESDRDLIYTNSDGSRYRKTGGSRSWLNNNPGNLKYYDFAVRAGAIGQANGYAVFPDEATGMRAVEKLLRSDRYKNLTIANAVLIYAPPKENDVTAYRRNLQEITGLSINRVINDLTDEELSRLVNAIKTIEGWKVGRIIQ